MTPPVYGTFNPDAYPVALFALACLLALVFFDGYLPWRCAQKRE